MSRSPPAFNLPPAILWLTGALIGIHVIRQFLGESAETWLVVALSFIPARYSELAEALPGGTAAWFWSPFSHAFLHADAIHLIVNLFWMASFGSALARRFGSLRFLVLSAISAAAGAAAHYAFHAADAALMLGASGAVSGMMAATARFAFAEGGPLGGGGTHPAAYFLPAEPLGAVLQNSRALTFILIWFGINLVFGLQSGLVPGVSNPIAWQAHVGGFFGGLFLFPLLDPVPREPRLTETLETSEPPE